MLLLAGDRVDTVSDVSNEPRQPDDLPDDLRSRRARLGLSQATVAERANCSSSFISYLESGTLERVAEVLGLTITTSITIDDAAPVG